jgi:hypothetical protein
MLRLQRVFLNVPMKITEAGSGSTNSRQVVTCGFLAAYPGQTLLRQYGRIEVMAET